MPPPSTTSDLGQSVPRKTVILIIDDDQPFTAVLKERLSIEGAQVEIANSGAEALQYLINHHPHVIVLDIMMPGENGIEVLKKIKDDSTIASIPVIVVTALSDKKVHEEVMRNGAVSVMVKTDVDPMSFVKEVLTRAGDVN